MTTRERHTDTDIDTDIDTGSDSPDESLRTSSKSRRSGRYRLGAALMALGLVAAACGSDGADTAAESAGATSDEASDAAASDEEMSDEEMSDEEMSDEEMSDEEMSDDEMSDDEMSDDEMSDDEMSDDEMSEAMNDLMSQITNRSDLSILDDAIHAADLQDVLHDEGPFTIFAPTNEAFEAYLGEMGMSAEEALGDVATLTTLLQAHVIDGANDSAAVVGLDGQSLTALAGNELAISVDGTTVTVGDATVIETDVSADNGVIHIIDTVLTPPAG